MEAMKRHGSAPGRSSTPAMLFWGLFDVPVTLQRCQLPRPTLSLPPQHHLSLRPAPFPHIDRSRRGFFLFSSRDPGTALHKLISRQIVSFLRRARFIFFYCLPAFFSYSGSGEARARAGSSARAARSPCQPRSGFVSFLTRAPRCWYRTSQGTKSWTCRASTQPCFSRMGCEAAGSTGTRDKGWGGFGRKVLSGFVKHEPGWRFG